jgi:hypothetical protein
LDRPAALKPLPGQTARSAREVAALRQLRIPGVVALYDVVEGDGELSLIMERVEGRPFPGGLQRRPDGGVEWEELRGTAVGFFETLGAVHARGMLHRDLKPSNVLVRADGQAVILDFGLARGTIIGATVTARGALLGTPAYLSPEQFAGRPADARSDLYAVGVMLFEALAGRRPHEGDDPTTLAVARRGAPAPSLARYRPDLPGRVIRTVDQLLARRADDRPASAAAALAGLGGAQSLELPFLGSRAAIQTCVDRLMRGLPVRLSGPQGGGRSRAVAEIVAELRAAGLQPEQAHAGARPFEVLGLDHEPRLTAEQPSERLAFLLHRGPVLVDDAERVDPWSAPLLQAATGPLLRVLTSPAPADVELRPLEAKELQDLFGGPEALLFLRSDPARLLHERTGGLPALIERELRSWQAGGLARALGDGRVRLEREAIEQLAVDLGQNRALPWREDLHLRPLGAQILSWIVAGAGALARKHLYDLITEPRWVLDLELDLLIAQGAAAESTKGQLFGLAWPAGGPPWHSADTQAAHRRLAGVLGADPRQALLQRLAAAESAGLAAAGAKFAGTLLDAGRPIAAGAAARRALDGIKRDDPAQAMLLVTLIEAAWQQRNLLLLREVRHRLQPAEGAAAPTEQPIDPAQASLAAPEDWPQTFADGEELLRAPPRTLTGLHAPARDRLLRLIDACMRGLGGTPPEPLGGPAGGPEVGTITPDVRLWVLEAELAVWRTAKQGPAALRALLHTLRAQAGEAVEQIPQMALWGAQAAFLERDWPGALRAVDAVDAEALPHLRVPLLLRAAHACMEEGRLSEAVQRAELAGSVAAILRDANRQVEARVFARAAAHRGGISHGADEAGFAACQEAVPPEHPGLVTLAAVESWAALRAGDDESARRFGSLAQSGMERLGMTLPAAHSRAVRLCAGDAVSTEGLLEAALQAKLPDVGLDILGLLAKQGPLPPETLEQAIRFAASFPEERWTHRRGVYSVTEALAQVRAASEGPPG